MRPWREYEMLPSRIGNSKYFRNGLRRHSILKEKVKLYSSCTTWNMNNVIRIRKILKRPFSHNRYIKADGHEIYKRIKYEKKEERTHTESWITLTRIQDVDAVKKLRLVYIRILKMSLSKYVLGSPNVQIRHKRSQYRDY